VIRGLQAPTSQQITLMQNLGLSSLDLSANLGKKGLTGTLQEISDAITSHMGPDGLVIQDTLNNAKQAAKDAQIEIKAMPASLQSLANQFLAGSISAGDWRKALKDLAPEQQHLMTQFASTADKTMSFNKLLTSGGPEAQTYANALKTITGQADAASAALLLTGQNAGTFGSNVQKVSDAAKNAGDNVEHWGIIQKTFNNQQDVFNADMKAASVSVGQFFMPMASSLMTGFHWIVTAGDDASKSVDNVGGSWDMAALSAKNLKDRQDELKTAEDNLKQAQDNLKPTSDALAAAQKDVADKQKTANDMLDKFGENSPQYQRSVNDLTTAENNLNVKLDESAQSTLNVTNKTSELTIAKGHLKDAEKEQADMQTIVKGGLDAQVDTIKNFGPAAASQIKSVDDLAVEVDKLTAKSLNVNAAIQPALNSIQGIGSTIDRIQSQGVQNTVNQLQKAATSIQGTTGTAPVRGVVQAKASGGPVRAGESYLVGDNPDGTPNSTSEIFVPGTNGTILSSRETKQAMSAGRVTMNNTFHIYNQIDCEAALREQGWRLSNA